MNRATTSIKISVSVDKETLDKAAGYFPWLHRSAIVQLALHNLVEEYETQFIEPIRNGESFG